VEYLEFVVQNKLKNEWKILQEKVNKLYKILKKKLLNKKI
jgi:hypothetical protein